MKAVKNKSRGFTLIELMVTLAIGSILMLIAVPTFETYRRNSELTAATNTLFSAINAARGEAMKRGMSAMVVAGTPTDAGNPPNATNWNTGLIVFIDTDRNQEFSAADTIISTQTPLPAYMTVVGNNTAGLGTKPYIMFDPSGYSKTRAGGFGALSLTLRRNDLDVAGVTPPDQTRLIIISSTGRARTCRPTTVNDVNCQAALVQ
jgi:type IV fimbrial biogenesis protein FimT